MFQMIFLQNISFIQNLVEVYHRSLTSDKSPWAVPACPPRRPAFTAGRGGGPMTGQTFLNEPRLH